MAPDSADCRIALRYALQCTAAWIDFGRSGFYDHRTAYVEPHRLPKKRSPKKTIYSVALAGALAFGLAAAAQAQSLAPTVPNPANPTPLNPVATDGSPLPYRGAGDNGSLLTGRSFFAPVGAAVGTGLGVANTAVDAGLGTVNAVVGGDGVR